MPYVAQVASERRPLLNVYGGDYPTPDGTGVRDYIHIMDLAEGHWAAVRKILQSSTGQLSSCWAISQDFLIRWKSTRMEGLQLGIGQRLLRPGNDQVLRGGERPFRPFRHRGPSGWGRGLLLLGLLPRPKGAGLESEPDSWGHV